MNITSQSQSVKHRLRIKQLGQDWKWMEKLIQSADHQTLQQRSQVGVSTEPQYAGALRPVMYPLISTTSSRQWKVQMTTKPTFYIVTGSLQWLCCGS